MEASCCSVSHNFGIDNTLRCECHVYRRERPSLSVAKRRNSRRRRRRRIIARAVRVSPASSAIWASVMVPSSSSSFTGSWGRRSPPPLPRPPRPPPRPPRDFFASKYSASCGRPAGRAGWPAAHDKAQVHAWDGGPPPATPWLWASKTAESPAVQATYKLADHLRAVDEATSNRGFARGGTGAAAAAALIEQRMIRAKLQAIL